VVVLAGRERFFSAGFDLEIIAKRNDETITMLRGGFDLAIRLLSFPSPVVAACTGHGLAMGSFLLCSIDYRVGANGPFKIGANEVAIGMTMPAAALAIVNHRLAPQHVTRAVALAEIFDPATAVQVGFLDEVVDASLVVSRAQEVAQKFTALDRKAHLATKMKMRQETIAAMRGGIDTEYPLRA
jgi:enoyl-CoA hydratase